MRSSSRFFMPAKCGHTSIRGSQPKTWLFLFTVAMCPHHARQNRRVAKERGEIVRKRYVVLISPEGSNTWAIVSPSSFSTLERARGWAKERAEFNAAHHSAPGEYMIAELVPRETVKWDKILNAGQHPGVVSCASYDPAGGARNSASTILKGGRPCSK